MSKSKFILFLFVVSVFSCQSGHGNGVDSSSNSIQDARTAYFQMEHEQAYTICLNVWNDTAQKSEDRAMAALMLSKMDWLFYQKSDKALERLGGLESMGELQSELHTLRARILADEGRFEEAITTVDKSMAYGKSETEKYRAILGTGRVILARYKSNIFNDGGSVSEDSRLNDTFEMLRTQALEKPGDVDIAQLYLGYALVLKKGKEAFNAWMSYYRLTDPSQVHTSLLPDVSKFREALESYGENGSGNAGVNTIIKGLAESGFYEYALFVKMANYGKAEAANERVNEIVKYYDFLNSIDGVTIDYYLKTVAGEDDRSKYQKAMREEAQKLWDVLKWEAEKPKLSDEGFVKELEKRFKAIMTFISANGYYGLHMGHIVLDDRRQINQYNESAEFRYIAIDHMVSNGYSGWFWDGNAETGGWANDDGAFLQVRSAYTSGPIGAWLMVTDPVESARVEENLEQLARMDDSLASVNPYAFLPGLTLRLRYNERKGLLDSLVAAGNSGTELRLTFVNLIERMVQGSSIYAHEGRHAIDKKNNYSSRSEELEFTAKLSEVYFAEKPFLAVLATMGRNLGDGTSHGNSNLRVVKKLVQWMEGHRGEIAGFDTNRPTMPQLDKLTENQLRAAIKSFDPMAN